VNDPIRRRSITLRAGDQLPVDDITITVDRRVTLTIEAPREVPIGQIRRADGGQREASD
jgi:hypothetical protein